MTDFWHDVSTTPKGRWVLVTVAGMAAGFYAIAALIDGTWVKHGDGMTLSVLNMGPTHWAPIDEPPQYEKIT